MTFMKSFSIPISTQDDSSVKLFSKRWTWCLGESRPSGSEEARHENDVEKVYLYGEVADAVLRYVEKNLIDLIIVGHHGRSGASVPC